MKTIYDFTVKDADLNDFSLEEYKNKLEDSLIIFSSPCEKKSIPKKEFSNMKRTAWSHVGVTWGLIWVTFGSLWGYFGHLRLALGDLWVILRSLWRYDAYMWGLGGAFFDLVLAR